MVPRQSDGMTAVTATRPSPKAQGSWSPSQSRTKPSTTPAGPPARTPSSAGQRRPDTASKGHSSHGRAPLGPSSPNYFDFLSDPDSNPPNSNAGIHAKKNWSPPIDAAHPPVATSSAHYPLEHQPRFENFKRESENSVFRLSHGGLDRFSTGSGSRISPPIQSPIQTTNQSPPASNKLSQSLRTDTDGDDKMEVDRIPDSLADVPRQPFDSQNFFGDERRDSPANDSNLDLSNIQRTQLSHIDERHPRNSLPHNRADRALRSPVQRSETLPSTLHTDGPTMILPDEASTILKQYSTEEILVLDLRVYPQFSKSRIAGALNLCIPTTLLKRVSFNIRKLAETFTRQGERAKFDQWPNTKAIIVYDGNSNQLQDAASCVNILKKFTSEHFGGATYILRGGFNAFSKKFAGQVDGRPAAEMNGSNMKGLSINPPATAPIAGGCAMPASQSAANPFFGTIRQNMDLIDGVGQMPINIPVAVKDKPIKSLPDWLRQASNADDKGRTVSDIFLGIERAEEQRMKKALSADVSYNTPQLLSPNNIQVAGIEKGLKNRYKDILPYDHTRVKLQGVASGDCDYVNASHVQAHGSNKRYIASQAPVPATFQDFWRVVWEQDARVIVMLTAETEGGNRKSHPYWVPDTYGLFKVKFLSERRMGLDRRDSHKPNRSFTTPLKVTPEDNSRPSMSRRHSSKHSFSSHSTGSTKSPSITSPMDPDYPHVIIRKVALSHTQAPFEPLREITQLHYSNWPDFGAPAHPAHVLGLVDRCNDVVRSYEQQQQGGTKSKATDPAVEDVRPIVVHCSAGCGRTGTFCTIDSVIDMLKRQRAHRRLHRDTIDPLQEPATEDRGVHDAMDIDPPSSQPHQLKREGTSVSPEILDPETEAWLHRDDIDLVKRTVADFRLQRLSMVQTLGQFVLCYESVLEWIGEEMEGLGEGKSWIDG